MRQAIFRRKPRALSLWQLGHAGLDARQHFVADDQRRQIGVGEVAIVHRVFLAAHGLGLASVRVEQYGGLLNFAPVFNLSDLPAHFKINRLLHELETVQVFDFAAGAKFLLTHRAHRHVDVTAERTVLHIAITNVKIAH